MSEERESAEKGLPEFPVHDSALDLIDQSLDPDGDRPSSLHATLDMLSEMGGSSPSAISASGVADWGFGEVEYVELRDQHYSVNDCVRALINEIRRLRGSDTCPISGWRCPQPKTRVIPPGSTEGGQ